MKTKGGNMKKKSLFLGTLVALLMVGSSSQASNKARWDSCKIWGLCQVTAPCSSEGWAPNPNISSNPDDPLYQSEPMHKVVAIAKASFRLVTVMQTLQGDCLYTLQRQ